MPDDVREVEIDIGYIFEVAAIISAYSMSMNKD